MFRIPSFVKKWPFTTWWVLGALSVILIVIGPKYCPATVVYCGGDGALAGYLSLLYMLLAPSVILVGGVAEEVSPQQWDWTLVTGISIAIAGVISSLLDVAIQRFLARRRTRRLKR